MKAPRAGCCGDRRRMAGEGGVPPAGRGIGVSRRDPGRCGKRIARRGGVRRHRAPGVAGDEGRETGGEMMHACGARLGRIDRAGRTMLRVVRLKVVSPDPTRSRRSWKAPDNMPASLWQQGRSGFVAGVLVS